MSRDVQEWRGKTDSTPVPPRVRARVFEAHGGICWLSKRKIRAGEKWEIEHKIALINGGSNRESNLAPALVEPHKIKTRADLAEKSKVARIRAKHLGIRKQSSFPCSRDSKWKRKFNGQVVPR